MVLTLRPCSLGAVARRFLRSERWIQRTCTTRTRSTRFTTTYTNITGRKILNERHKQRKTESTEKMERKKKGKKGICTEILINVMLNNNRRQRTLRFQSRGAPTGRQVTRDCRWNRRRRRWCPADKRLRDVPFCADGAPSDDNLMLFYCQSVIIIIVVILRLYYCSYQNSSFVFRNLVIIKLLLLLLLGIDL